MAGTPSDGSLVQLIFLFLSAVIFSGSRCFFQGEVARPEVKGP